MKSVREKRVQEEWGIPEGALGNTITVGLRGLKNLRWLTLQEYESILDLLQKCIENKEIK
jgi:hypothetical protein